MRYYQDTRNQDPEEFYVKQDRIGAHQGPTIHHSELTVSAGKGSFGEVYKGWVITPPISQRSPSCVILDMTNEL